MVWVCVCGLCGPSLLSLFRILGNEKAASWFPGTCSLRPPFRVFSSSSSLCLLLIPHISLPPALCCCEVWSNIFIKLGSSFYGAAEVARNAFIAAEADRFSFFKAASVSTFILMSCFCIFQLMFQIFKNRINNVRVMKHFQFNTDDSLLYFIVIRKEKISKVLE